MRIATVLLVWLVLATGALAQPVPIRTGEHADFTRVVLTIPTGADWQLGRDSAGYVLRLPVSEGYDTARFYDLIPPDRITAVSQVRDEGLLRMAVACPCNVDAFLYRPDILVIDVRDGPPTANSPFEALLDVPGPSLVGQQNSAFAIPRNPVLPIILPPPDAVSPASDPALAVAASAVGQMPEHIAPRPSSLNKDLAELEQAVTQSLARGLSQGLLDTGSSRDGAAPTLDQALRDALGANGAQAPGIMALTSVDQNATPPDPVVSSTQSGRSCLPSDYFDVASWGDERPFQTQIAEARARLTHEFDRTEEPDVMDLARLFIFFGFGREAVQVLELDGISSQERRYLTALAAIIDGDPLEPGLFYQQVSCPTSVALWAVLGQREGSMDADVDRASVMRSFKALPLALQAHLAPLLAERLIAIGDTNGASQALAVTRANPDRPVAAELAETALTHAMGAPEEAVAELAELASSDRRMTPEAMTEFLLGAIKTKKPVREEDFIFADALRFENAQMPVAGDLAVAQVRALLAADRFTTARALMVEESAAIGEDRLGALTEEYVSQSTDRMSDAAFLSFAFGSLPRPVSSLTENRLAQRLLDLGFPDRAAAMLSGDDEEEDRQILRAQIALESGDPETAVAALEGVTADRAQKLRRVAQDLAFADALVPDLSVTAGTAESLWRRGAWGELAQSNDPLLQAASSAVLRPEIAGLALDTPLASGRALLDQSAQSRAVLDDLLARFTTPEDF